MEAQLVSLALSVVGAVVGAIAAWQARQRSKEELDHLVEDAQRTAVTIINATDQPLYDLSFRIGGEVHEIGGDASEPATQAPVQDRIKHLVASLRDSQLLIAELQAEMDARTAAVERLRAEEEQSRQLAALRAEEALAVRNLVDAAITSAHAELQRRLEDERKELSENLARLQRDLNTLQSKNRRDQILFFALGALVSIPIGIGINLIF